MKDPNIAQGALVFAFTIAGACIGFVCKTNSDMGLVVGVVAALGGLAAMIAGDKS